MNPLDYYDPGDDTAMFSKMHRMALFIEKLIQAVEHLRKENEELKEKVKDGGS